MYPLTAKDGQHHSQRNNVITEHDIQHQGTCKQVFVDAEYTQTSYGKCTFGEDKVELLQLSTKLLWWQRFRYSIQTMAASPSNALKTLQNA